MPLPHILKITEIFPSIQGEGLRQGCPTLFVRLSGCNLKCRFCDTKYSWKEGKDYSVAKVVEEIKSLRRRFPARWVCVTGGEPLLQDITGLIRELKRENIRIQVETNGTFYHPLPVDWYTVSPKPEKYFFHPEYRDKAKEVKVLVTRELEFDVIRSLRREFPLETPLFLQPQSNRKWSMNRGMRILKKALNSGLKNIRLSVQLHKVYGLK
ncbi:MAG: 7-carboxy-7-deazaguanine synthase QueE [Candidatus Aminicenantaceae bacterium]